MVRIVPIALPLLFALSLASSAEDCPECKPGKICLPHEATDDIACKAAQVKLKTKDMMAKREAIGELSDAQQKHMNVLSRKITVELLKALADQDVDVKLYAAEKLAVMGEPSLAVQGLKVETAKYKKLVGSSKPKKEQEIPKWETNLKLLGLMYESLAAVKDPAAGKVFEEDVLDSSPFVCKVAANACAPLKGQKGIVVALWDAMNRWLGPSQKAPVPEGYAEAFFALSKALASVVENPPDKLDGTQPQQMAKWKPWWEANEAKFK